MKFTVLLFSFFALNCFSDEIDVSVKTIGEYKATITFNSDEAFGQLEIQKGNTVVYQQGEVGHHFFFGTEFDKEDTLSGNNITGNGIPNLVVTRWTGGANCCYLVSVFELGKNFRKIIEIDAFTTEYKFIDLDKDKSLEIEVMDGSIRGVFACTASSPNGRIVLKFKDDKYVVATDLMKKTEPTKKQINHLKSKIAKAFKRQDNPDLPYDFLETMMNLSYSGNLNLALQIAKESWPLNKKGFSKFKADFLACLNESSYWKEFSNSVSKSNKNL